MTVVRAVGVVCLLAAGAVADVATHAQEVVLLHRETIAETPLGAEEWKLVRQADGRVCVAFSECTRYVRGSVITFELEYGVRRGPGVWEIQRLNIDDNAPGFTLAMVPQGSYVHVFWIRDSDDRRHDKPFRWAALRGDSLVLRQTLLDTTFGWRLACGRYGASVLVAATNGRLHSYPGSRLYEVRGPTVRDLDFHYTPVFEISAFAPVDKRGMLAAGNFGASAGLLYSRDLHSWAQPPLPTAQRAEGVRVGVLGDKVLLFWENGKNGRFFPDQLWWTVGTLNGGFSQPDTLRSLSPPAVVFPPTVFSFRDRWMILFWDEVSIFGRGGQLRTVYRVFDGERWSPVRVFLPEGTIEAGAPEGFVDESGTLRMVYGVAVSDTNVYLEYGTARVELPTAVSGRKITQRVQPELGAAYPDPFNTSTRLGFVLRTGGHARLCLLNARGQLVRTLVNGWQQAGEHTVRWDGRDDAGRPLPSGVYIVRLEAGGQVATRKVVLVR